MSLVQVELLGLPLDIGGPLLTLAAPPQVVAYRRWFLEEFVRQVEGNPPLPWPGSPTDN